VVLDRRRVSGLLPAGGPNPSFADISYGRNDRTDIQCGWHQRGERLTVRDRVILLPIPPYVPESNPMENVWD
jgi:hypothetical protein